MSVTISNTPNSLVPQNMDQAVRLAEMMAKGKLVPQHLQGSPGDCLMIIEQAMRWGMSPFAVAQCTSLVKGRLNFEGKMVAAALHTSGALATRLDYKFEGASDALTCTVSATLAGETEPRSLTIKYKDVRTDNIWWAKQPEQQLSYSAARNWARRYAPEVMMGVYSPEEFDAPVTVAQPAYTGTTIDADEPSQPIKPYVIVKKNETLGFETIAEWEAAWENAVKRHVDANALDKLVTLRDINGSAMEAVHGEDADSALRVANMIEDALA